jgi:hypothetical protein
MDAHHRISCEQLLASPEVKSFRNHIWVDATINYDECLEPGWFDLNRVRKLSIRYFAAYSCPEEDFSDLGGITLGELPQRWQDRARCQTDGMITATWAYEMNRDTHEYGPDDGDQLGSERHQERWRMALMDKNSGPCTGMKREGDFRWQDCQFGLRQQRLPMPSHEADDITMRATYKEVHSIGLGFYLAGSLKGQMAQWQGEVVFGADQNTSRLTPAAPYYQFSFGKEAIAGEIYPPDKD